MRVTRGFVLVVTLAIVLGTMSPVGATAARPQKCSGPPATTQSGRASLTPGLSALGSAQKVVLAVSLFSCSPARTTRGSGSLKSTLTIKAPQTCGLLTNPHTVKATAVITWKDEFTSTIPMTFSLTGASQFVNVTGTVSSGLFKNHPITGQLHYADVVSPHGVSSNGPGIAQACKNKTKPNKYGRVSIVALTFVTTKSFVVH
jgi:hypothetical protein